MSRGLAVPGGRGVTPFVNPVNDRVWDKLSG
jgi:hypothetical protein